MVWSNEFTYYLGYLWADGYVCRNSIRLELNKNDMICIKDVLNKISFIKFNEYTRDRIGCKTQMSLHFCNTKLYDSFFSKYFINKSIKSPKELIEIIPKEYIRYFFLGLVDGDGCFYISKNKKNTQFSISSSYEQDWNHIVELFNFLDIKKYSIEKKINRRNGNSSSQVRVCNYNDLLKLSNYLYPHGYEIGLERKYDKCISIINNKPNITLNNEFIEKNKLIGKINELKTIQNVAIYFKCSKKKIFNYCKKYDIKEDGFYQTIKLKKNEYLSLSESKTFIQKFKLKSKKDWVLFCKEGKRPNNIPSNPFVFYKEMDWISYGDWLGF